MKKFKLTIWILIFNVINSYAVDIYIWSGTNSFNANVIDAYENCFGVGTVNLTSGMNSADFIGKDIVIVFGTLNTSVPSPLEVDLTNFINSGGHVIISMEGATLSPSGSPLMSTVWNMVTGQSITETPSAATGSQHPTSFHDVPGPWHAGPDATIGPTTVTFASFGNLMRENVIHQRYANDPRCGNIEGMNAVYPAKPNIGDGTLYIQGEVIYPFSGGYSFQLVKNHIQAIIKMQQALIEGNQPRLDSLNNWIVAPPFDDLLNDTSFCVFPQTLTLPTYASYSWENLAGTILSTNQSYDIPSAGTYIINTVGNPGQCDGKDTIQISLFNIAFDTLINQPCSIDSTGKITLINVSNSSNITYQLDNNPPQPDSIFTGVTIGSHKIYLYNTSGCSDSVEINIQSTNNCNTVEICNNGIDDDGDGLIDLNDTTDCICDKVNFVSPTFILNGDLESTSCCPNNSSQMGCVDEWQNGNAGTSDYSNSCDYTLPFLGTSSANGNGYVNFAHGGGSGTWQENIGTCLQNQMIAGKSYEFEFDLGFTNFTNNTTMSLYGATTCGDLPATSAGLECVIGSGSWIELGNVNVTWDSVWNRYQITFTPTTNIDAIIIGPYCGAPMFGGINRYGIDNITLIELPSSHPPITISQSGSFCTSNLTLTANYTGNFDSVQWYKDDIALINEQDTIIYFGDSLFTGRYTVRFNDSNSCFTDTIHIDTSYLTFSLNTSKSCIGSSNGEIEVSPIVGINISQPYSYTVNGSSPSNDSVFNNLSPGNYEVIVYDVSGCSDTITTLIDSLNSPLANFLFDSVCINTPTSFSNSSTISAGSITNGYYEIAGNILNALDTNYTFPSSGNHDVLLIITSDSGCRDTINYDVLVYDIPTASFTVNNGCEKDEVFFTNTSTLATSYKWYAGTIDSSSIENPLFLFDTNGIYTIELIATNPNNCKDTAQQQVIIHPKPVANFTIDTVCQGEPLTITNTSSITSGDINRWFWNDGSIIIEEELPSIIYNTPGNKIIQLIIESNEGCRDTIAVTTTVLIKPTADFSYEITETNTSDIIVDLTNNSTNGTNYEWLFNSSDLTTDVNPIFNYSQKSSCDNLIIQLVASNNSCEDTKRKEIIFETTENLYIPNSFSPNGDGINDSFKPMIRISSNNEYSFRIYNRWGLPIFSTNDPNNAWDGSFKNMTVQNGVYVWKIQGQTGCDNLNIEKIGHVTIIK